MCYYNILQNIYALGNKQPVCLARYGSVLGAFGSKLTRSDICGTNTLGAYLASVLFANWECLVWAEKTFLTAFVHHYGSLMSSRTNLTPPL
jgi:hypothetical protein